MSTIGNKIKSRRKELRLSVDKLAELLDKNRATVYRYESDEIDNMPLSVLEPLAKALKVTPAYLMGWNENEPEDSAKKKEFLHLEERDIIRKYRKLDDKGRHTVNTVLDMEYNRLQENSFEVVAAHNDDYSEEQQSLMKEDLAELEKLHARKTKPR